jgi:exodeoxyribonuclease V beta subunit
VAGDLSVLNAGLAAALTTPLGPTLHGARLADLRRADRLDELSFELPLAGGDDPSGEVTTADLAALVGEYLAPGAPLAGYGERLADPVLFTSLRGYLTGSLDLVFRQRGDDGSVRWYVADYKTNWLGETGRTLTAWQYRPEMLAAEMQRRHYPLQALLYLVALHRYLRWRQPGYDPGTHLGGALYLFLRGMIGPSTPVIDGQPCGVFAWTPPASLIVRCSDLLAEGTPTP